MLTGLTLFLCSALFPFLSKSRKNWQDVMRHTGILRTGVERLGGWWGMNRLYLSCSAFLPSWNSNQPPEAWPRLWVIELAWVGIICHRRLVLGLHIVHPNLSSAPQTFRILFCKSKLFFFNAVFMMHKIRIHMLKNMFRNSLFFLESIDLKWLGVLCVCVREESDGKPPEVYPINSRLSILSL